MVVVALVQLVLDDNRVARLVFGYQIDAERTGSLLSIGAGKIQIQELIQNIDVLLEPSAEIKRLVLPHFSQRNTL